MDRHKLIYVRSGTCNQCGECCGFPRATDGGQNNAWPTDWPEAVSTWKVKPAIFDMLKKHKIKGLTKSKTDLCCPFLSEKLPDGTVPCKLYETQKAFWRGNCEPAPSLEIDDFQLEVLRKNCPSCSYVYLEKVSG